MKHELSEAEKVWRSRPFPHTGRFWGAATVACVVVPYYLWQADFYRIVVLIPYLLAVPQIQTVNAVRSRFKEVVRIAVGTKQNSISFTGLDDMDAFLNDIVSTYERCVLSSDEEGVEHAQHET